IGRWAIDAGQRWMAWCCRIVRLLWGAADGADGFGKGERTELLELLVGVIYCERGQCWLAGMGQLLESWIWIRCGKSPLAGSIRAGC
ncbi:hypothetical protein ACLOJK_029679, partial [Asimina triloba]